MSKKTTANCQGKIGLPTLYRVQLESNRVRLSQKTRPKVGCQRDDLEAQNKGKCPTTQMPVMVPGATVAKLLQRKPSALSASSSSSSSSTPPLLEPSSSPIASSASSSPSNYPVSSTSENKFPSSSPSDSSAACLILRRLTLSSSSFEAHFLPRNFLTAFK